MKIIVNGNEFDISKEFENFSKKDINCFEIAKKLNFLDPSQALCINVNGTLKDLTYIPKKEDEIDFINFSEKEGKKVFWHTSAHVLAEAVINLWPEAKPTIGPAIEEGFYYDFANLQISEKDLPLIEKEMKKIIKDNNKPKKIIFKNKDEAKDFFKGNKYKEILIDEIEDGIISAYQQGDFVDLCRGPHLPNIGKIKAFKLMKLSGAYWKGDSKNETLTRIYGISFPDKKLLQEYLTLLEEAKKRDHKLLGKNLDLFSFHDVAAGMVFLHPRGMHIWNNLLNYLNDLLKKANYLEIKTPIMMSKDLWETSGHWFFYRENMYVAEVEDKEYAIKPMNCPGCMLFYKTKVHSYREFPLKVAEIGLVHRHELSGALSGLFRVRSFHQDDAHVFMTKEQITSQIIDILNMANDIYMTFGLTYKLELSTRPNKSKTIGSDEDWEYTTNALKKALDQWGHSYKINEGDGAFYGPKIDIHIKDALSRFWQCGTIQLDMSLPEKFKLEYVSDKGERLRPIMVHRALFGSVERFFGILIEHFSGKFPLWISPYPIKIIPVADRHIQYATKIAEKIQEKGFLCEIDSTSESVSKKIREAQLLKTNYMLTIGDKEKDNSTISVRTRDNLIHGEIDVEKFIQEIVKERDNKDLISPFSKKEK